MLGFLDRKRNTAAAPEPPHLPVMDVAAPNHDSDADMESAHEILEPAPASVEPAPAAPADNGAAATSSPGAVDGSKSPKKRGKYSIRLVPILDHNAIFPAKYVKMAERQLDSDGIIRLGRVETAHPHFKNIEPIVFRSKVVSRVHAEVFLEGGKWFIRDIQSSSGTFVNSARLSPPNQPSANRPLQDNDTLQLGLNFRGGSQESYQCVKLRVLLDYSWRRQVTPFNVERHDELRKSVAGGTGASGAFDKFEECSICLFQLQPSQPLFISPCSHGWHYKCIRPLLIRGYPNFQCPNCRGMYDLEEDDEE